MLSKGGKIEYSCPYCKSTDIRYVHVKEEAWAILAETPTRYAHGSCNNCNGWFYWSLRLKRSLKHER